MYCHAPDSWCTVFQNRFDLFIGHASFFHFALCLFAKIAFCAVQNTKGKLIFRKIENIQLCHFVSSVAQKRNPLNFINFSCVQIQALKISEWSGDRKWIFYKLSSQKKLWVMLNFFLCVYIVESHQVHGNLNWDHTVYVVTVVSFLKCHLCVAWDLLQKRLC